jgi:hypothetical protein
MTKFAETPPAMCSGCFGQYPDRQHIDFESSWDGPVVEGGAMGENGQVISRIPVSIDELILCEDCVREGASLLGLSEENTAKLDQLRAEIIDLKARNKGLDTYVNKLEQAVRVRPRK